MLKPAIESFLEKINVANNGCWIWLGGKNTDGYGYFYTNSKTVRCSRFIYEYYYGQICPDLVLDHLCRNRACVNPVHLEQVTIRKNILRGFGVTAINFKKTHCPQGHEYDDENTYIFKGNGSRRCKICITARQKKYQLADPIKFKRLKAISAAKYYKIRQQDRLK